MADNIPSVPPGAVPPRPAEAAKVQPKKETVRINLPPKPTAAPTIKIPVPAAAPAGGTAAPQAVVSAAPAAPTAAPPAPSAAAPPVRPVVVAAPPAAVTSRPAPTGRPVAAAPSSGLDVALAVLAILATLGGAGRLLLIALAN